MDNGTRILSAMRTEANDNTTTIESALRVLLRARNRHDALRNDRRKLARHDIRMLRAARMAS